MVELPRSPLGLYGPGTYIPSRSKKLLALYSYLKLLRFLLPTDSSICSSFLWHSDLHTENIFVNPERPTEVLCIIDWQSTELLPLFDHARQPYFLDYNGPPVIGLGRPSLPGNLSEMSQAEQKEARSLHLQMSLSSLYRHLVHRDTPRLHKAMEYRDTTSFDMLVLAQNLLVDGEALYRDRVLELQKEWPDLPGVQAAGSPSFPVQLSADEINSLDRDVAGTMRGMELMAELKLSLGELWPERGLVRHDEYDEAKGLLTQAKIKIVDQLECSDEERRVWNHFWPFDS